MFEIKNQISFFVFKLPNNLEIDGNCQQMKTVYTKPKANTMLAAFPPEIRMKPRIPLPPSPFHTDNKHFESGKCVRK